MDRRLFTRPRIPADEEEIEQIPDKIWPIVPNGVLRAHPPSQQRSRAVRSAAQPALPSKREDRLA